MHTKGKMLTSGEMPSLWTVTILSLLKATSRVTVTHKKFKGASERNRRLHNNTGMGALETLKQLMESRRTS